MKIKIVPAGKPAGVTCFAFVQKEHRDAWLEISNAHTISEKKLKALSSFGVKASISGELPKVPHAV